MTFTAAALDWFVCTAGPPLEVPEALPEAPPVAVGSDPGTWVEAPTAVVMVVVPASEPVAVFPALRAEADSVFML